ncbi:MAG: class II D-tagatose-bisphosphate aldolase, non-catalytic subunit, partial [Ignavibacteria bacterium]|nr:class II D-tagatose-bisphosphate aldolase, non-catalytic subunit [Ignavibacteria bacterium]
FALASIEDELHKYSNSITPSNFRKIVEDEMIQNPKYWINHYHGTEGEIGIARLFSYSDRIRYYWNSKNINSSLNVLLNNLEHANIPESLISQYLPTQYSEIKESKIENNPGSIINSKISRVLSIYQSATRGFSEE